MFAYIVEIKYILNGLEYYAMKKNYGSIFMTMW